MTIEEILGSKSLKAAEKRAQLRGLLVDEGLALEELAYACQSSSAQQTALILETIEEISNKKMKPLEEAYIAFAGPYLLSDNNACKREASRIIGNLAEQYPKALESVIKGLIKNTGDDSTIVRWGSAYALSRIVVLPEFVQTELWEAVNKICAREQESGVKNQYVKAIKKGGKLRG